MGRNLNTTVWSVDQNGCTQIVHELFTGENPTYTHGEHIDNSFNFCVNGVAEQNSRMCLHMTNRTDNEYNIDSVPNVFIGDMFYDNRGSYSDRVNNILIGTYGGVSNFAIDPNSGSQPASDFKIQPTFNYRNALWYPRIGFAEYNRNSVTYTYYTLNDLDGTCTADDAENNETWWEYYTRKSADYVMTLDAYNDGAYYTGGAFQSNSIVEGQTRFGFSPAWITWLSTPYYWGYAYGAKNCYYYYDNGQYRYSDLTFDVILPLSADAMTKIDEYDDTWNDSYNNPYPRHVIVYTPKIDKDLVLRLICSYGLPFSFSSSTTNRQFADPDYALPVILNNTTTGEYVRGSDCITSDTENNRWVNTADIDNKPASGGGGGGGGDELVEMPSRGQFYGSGITTYYVDPPTAKLQTALGNWDNVQTGKDVLKNLISYKLLCFPQRLFTNGMLHDFVIAGTTLKDSDNNTIQAAKLTQYGAVNLPSIVIPRTFNDFRDYAPYTNMSMYVPLCGWFQLPPWCMGRTISGEMYINGYTGTVKCIVRADGNVITELGGNAAVDLPFTAEAVGMKSAAVLSNIINTAGSIGAMVANPSIGSAANVGTSVLGTVCALNANYTESKGTMGDGSNIAGLYNVYIKISRPATVDNNGNSLIAIPTEYKRQYGLPCNKSLTLTQGDGYTQILDANITGNMTAREKQMIIDGFRRGLIL